MNRIHLVFLSLMVFSLVARSSPNIPWIEIYNKARHNIHITAYLNDTSREDLILFNKKILHQNDKLRDNSWLKGENLTIDFYISYRKDKKCVTEIYKISKLASPETTIYLSFNPEKSIKLYPQTGTFMGLSGISDSGYPLKYNITRPNMSFSGSKIEDCKGADCCR